MDFTEFIDKNFLTWINHFCSEDQEQRLDLEFKLKNGTVAVQGYTIHSGLAYPRISNNCIYIYGSNMPIFKLRVEFTEEKFDLEKLYVRPKKQTGENQLKYDRF